MGAGRTDPVLRAAVVPPAGAHGGDGVRLARALGLDPASVIDLSASLNPFAPDVGAVLADVLQRRPDALGAYPDRGPATEALADAIGVDPARLVLTNGGAEAIALVAGLERRGRVEEPEFSLYRRHLAEAAPDAPRWRSNPSNPLGRLAGATETARVWDEAFYAIATGAWTRGDEGGWRLGSLTKLWACPGLRLGYAIAPDAEAAAALCAAQPRWAVNGLALAALPVLLARSELDGWPKATAALRHALAAALRNEGFDVIDTDVNWLLVRRPGLRDALARRGVVVRDCASFGLHDVCRVALPRPEQLAAVVRAFAEVGPVPAPGACPSPGS